MRSERSGAREAGQVQTVRGLGFHFRGDGEPVEGADRRFSRVPLGVRLWGSKVEAGKPVRRYHSSPG